MDNSAFTWRGLLKNSFVSALWAAVLVTPLVGLRTVSDESGVLGIDFRPEEIAVVVAAVVVVRLLLPLAKHTYNMAFGIGSLIFMFAIIGYAEALSQVSFAALMIASLMLCIAGFTAVIKEREVWIKLSRRLSSTYPGTGNKLNRDKGLRPLLFLGILLALAFPFFPSTDRYILDLAILILTYLVLGWGLNIVVGLAGLLDLGFVAFYAVGAYTYSLLAIHFDLSFWACLPLAGILAAVSGLLLGFPVLRLRGDYFAIVTLGFGEIIRIVLLNWSEMSGGPDGLTGVPRPSLFGIAEFTRRPDAGVTAFHDLVGIEYSPMHRIIFLYFIVLALALVVNFVALRLRKMPIGRAWEALREDDIACQSIGINRTNIKLAAFMISASFGGVAGAFFATRQGYVSPESFTFIESAIVIAIVILGGMGSQLGVLLATLVIIGLPEMFREVEEYRMLAFGAAMVMIMIWRPGGILSHRSPSVRYADADMELPHAKEAAS